jgi:hypothetical protein
VVRYELADAAGNEGVFDPAGEGRWKLPGIVKAD